jgi:hypothetical protein
MSSVVQSRPSPSFPLFLAFSTLALLLCDLHHAFDPNSTSTGQQSFSKPAKRKMAPASGCPLPVIPARSRVLGHLDPWQKLLILWLAIPLRIVRQRLSWLRLRNLRRWWPLHTRQAEGSRRYTPITKIGPEIVVIIVHIVGPVEFRLSIRFRTQSRRGRRKLRRRSDDRRRAQRLQRFRSRNHFGLEGETSTVYESDRSRLRQRVERRVDRTRRMLLLRNPTRQWFRL